MNLSKGGICRGMVLAYKEAPSIPLRLISDPYELMA